MGDVDWLARHNWIPLRISNMKVVQIASKIFHKRYPRSRVSKLSVGIDSTPGNYLAWCQFDLCNYSGDLKLSRKTLIRWTRFSDENDSNDDLLSDPFQVSAMIVGKYIHDPLVLEVPGVFNF